MLEFDKWKCKRKENLTRPCTKLCPYFLTVEVFYLRNTGLGLFVPWPNRSGKHASEWWTSHLLKAKKRKMKTRPKVNGATITICIRDNITQKTVKLIKIQILLHRQTTSYFFWNTERRLSFLCSYTPTLINGCVVFWYSLTRSRKNTVDSTVSREVIHNICVCVEDYVYL